MVKKHIDDRYFKYIYEGVKTIEGREISDFWNIDILGKAITFHNGKEEFDCVITRCNVYIGICKEGAIRTMLNHEGVKNMLPDIDNIDDGVNIYMKFGNNIDNRMGAFYINVISNIREYKS